MVMLSFDIGYHAKIIGGNPVRQRNFYGSVSDAIIHESYSPFIGRGFYHGNMLYGFKANTPLMEMRQLS